MSSATPQEEGAAGSVSDARQRQLREREIPTLSLLLATVPALWEGAVRMKCSRIR